jgi:hypothetical protein
MSANPDQVSGNPCRFARFAYYAATSRALAGRPVPFTSARIIVLTAGAICGNYVFRAWCRRREDSIGSETLDSVFEAYKLQETI